jgi:hypothetical protein
MIGLYERYFNKDKPVEEPKGIVVELKDNFIAETVLFNEAKFVIGYSVYVEKGMPKIRVIERPPPEHGRECKCHQCIVTNLKEIEKILEARNKNEQTK